MDLLSQDFHKLTRDLESTAVSSFRQDSKLVEAIDKLFYRNHLKTKEKDDIIILPERKLQFHEVQDLLKLSLNGINEDNSLRDINNQKKSTIKKIEAILADINQSAEAGDNPKLIIRNQRLWSNCIYDLDRVTLRPFNEAKKTTVSFSSKEDKTRFSAIVFVLTKVHELMLKNLTVTRRELFYQNVSRLRNQANLDVAVRDVCCLLETPPWSLGIVATSKGLIAGPVTLHYRDGTVVDCMAASGMLIPQDIEKIKEFKSTAKYILVVEKDAVFQKLLDEGAMIRLGPVIIMTGKGYPDVCTRLLLCRLSAELRLRPLALVDPDPHGYEIFLTYKYGSLAQSHLSASLACGSLALIGGRHHDVMTLASSEARLPLSNLDRRKLKALLTRPYLDNALGSRIKAELSAILASGVKAELEALAPTAAALCDAYMPSKLIQGDYLG